MRLKIFILCLVALFVSQTSRAQWVVTDPGNLAQGIINATKPSTKPIRQNAPWFRS